MKFEVLDMNEGIYFLINTTKALSIVIPTSYAVLCLDYHKSCILMYWVPCLSFDIM